MKCTIFVFTLGNLRNYDGNCNENIILKLNSGLSEVSCDYSMLIRLYKIGGVRFRLLGTNGFHVKAKNERFTAASSRCRQNLKYENFTSSFGRLRQNIAPKSVLLVKHEYFLYSTKPSYWLVALSLTLPSSNLKLPNSFQDVRGSRLAYTRKRAQVPPTCTTHVYHTQRQKHSPKYSFEEKRWLCTEDVKPIGIVE